MFQASEKELIWVIRVSVLVIGVVSVVVALAVKSVIYLLILCMDLVYVILFPQLCCVLFFQHCNTYGAAVGYVVGLILRLLAGDPFLDIPAVIKYPYYQHDTQDQLFPYRSLAMLLGLLLTLGVSYLTRHLFTKGVIPLKYDVFKCFPPEKPAEPNGEGAKDSDVLMLESNM